MTQDTTPKAPLDRGTIVTIHVEGKGSFTGKVIKYKASRRAYLVRCRQLSQSTWISEDYLLKRT